MVNLKNIAYSSRDKYSKVLYLQDMLMSDKFSPDLVSAPADKVFYALTMFPYPSGVGLHAGHASVFTINDVIARHKRMSGYTVFNPFGFDAFGLPTENYALAQGKGAREVTDINKAMFLDQVKALDISFDYERIIDTSMPDYYKWTQWIFTKLMEAGLVYREEKFVNRCPVDQTVLANDQVVDGKCERCKSEVIQKKHMQWFIKITDYADRLISDLDLVDRPEETKITQRNWIGKSQGAEIDFKIEKNNTILTVFTTRPDTLYGVTAVVLAPENTLIDELLSEEKKLELQTYRNTVLAKTAVQRQQDIDDKKGIFSGIFATHPLTGEQVPVWFADYVLMDYGSGAVMMVPGHDERDFLFRKSNQDKEWILLPRLVIHVWSHFIPEWKEIGRVTDGFDKNIYNRKELPSVLTSNWNPAMWDLHKLINSDIFNSKTINEAKEAIIAHLESLWLGKRKITYRLRDRSVSRQRYRGSPIPVYYDENNIPQPIPASELPVILPLDVNDFKPKGKSPLEDHPTFKYYKKDGNTYLRECDTLDTFMCSSFYFLRFPDAHNDEELIRKELADKCLPVDFYSGGKEHSVGHLLYSRFIHKFLYDQWYVSSPEPFMKLVHQGMVLGADGRKMGKRYNNGVDPLEIVDKYGSDAVRTYLMFMGPIELDKVWNDNALHGMKKFLDKVAKLPDQTRFGTVNEDVIATIHETIQKVTEDIELYKFNTAISKIMIAVNTIYEHSAIDAEHLWYLVQLLSCFAPKLAQTLREQSWRSSDIAFSSRPVADTSKITLKAINFPIQINGKMRGTLSVPSGITESELLALVYADEHLIKYLTGTTKKIIFVADKIINIINN